MNIRRVLITALALAIIAGVFVYLYAGSSVPLGQHPLVRLNAANFAEFENAFNASTRSVRVIAMLSPT